jgi:hypothetical protein
MRFKYLQTFFKNFLGKISIIQIFILKINTLKVINYLESIQFCKLYKNDSSPFLHKILTDRR